MDRRMARGLWVAGLLAVLGSLAPAGPQEETRPSAPTEATTKARAARRAFEEARTFFLQRRIEIDTMYLWSIRLIDAELAVGKSKPDRVALYQEHLDNMREIERILKAAGRVGRTNGLEFASIEYYRIEAEQFLNREKAR